jgi:hypothetical protein
VRWSRFWKLALGGPPWSFFTLLAAVIALRALHASWGLVVLLPLSAFVVGLEVSRWLRRP